MGLFGRKAAEMAKRFDKSLDRATDPTLLEPNWDAILECVDQIRSGEVPAKHAVGSIRNKLVSDNPHSITNALLVLDACVKNCGSKVHTEIATKEFMSEYRELVVHKSEQVKEKSLEMLQCWAMAFVSQPAYKIIVDTHNLLKLSGFSFPPLKDPETMYIAQVAPEWVDGDNCFRCRVEFGLITRKHHCRACGQIFCDACSKKTMELPLLGIEKQVRVCDSCFDKGKNAGRNTNPQEEAKKKQAASATADKERELKEKEEEELQLALAISQSEAEAKERERKMYSIYNGEGAGGGRADDNSSIAPSESLGYRGTAPSMVDTDLGVSNDDPLAKYLNRDYWEKKTTEDNTIKKIEDWKISTPPVLTVPPLSECGSRKDSAPSFTLPPTPTVVGDDQAAMETIQFCDQLKEQVTMMDSRIRSNIARGRLIINDSAISALFEKLTAWHGEVLARMAKLDEDRVHLESLQDHLAHIGEARQAMDALREEHGRKMREEEEERRRHKQAVMQYKLEMMRAKKHEMLMNQRHEALERFQQNEMMHRMGGMSIGGGAPPHYGGHYMQQQQPMQHMQHPQHPTMYHPQQQQLQQPQMQHPQQQPVYDQNGGTGTMHVGMTNGMGGGAMGYGMQQPQPMQHVQQPQQHQPMQQQYHMGQQESSMVPNGVADQSIHQIPSHTHVQYAPVPDPSTHSIPPAHAPYAAAPPQQEEQSNLLISFD